MDFVNGENHLYYLVNIQKTKMFDYQHPFVTIAAQQYHGSSHALTKHTIYDYSQLFNLQRLMNFNSTTLSTPTNDEMLTVLNGSDTIDL